MSTFINRQDVVEHMKNGIVYKLREEVIDTVVNEQMTLFEECLRKRLEEATANLTLERIDYFREVLDLSEQLNISLRIDGEEHEQH